ncbi:hypothetical protein [Shouchella patagoniensis]|uniref:hypothetical protein n=1 Tax=Shouchella patagoniensis TaxID=228576 RepID=UPI000995096A|nr:hypothetical protein [Shouchella patagoniensis]
MSVKDKTRMEQIKVIESILRKYKTYQAGKLNLKKQLYAMLPDKSKILDFERVKEDAESLNSILESPNQVKHAKGIHEEILHYSLITDSVDIAIEQLEEIESEFVYFRYFDNRTIKETSIEMGYGEKHLFNLRNRVLDKLLISLKSFITN